MLRIGVAGLLANGTSAALASKSDDALRIGWGGDRAMISADNHLGGTREGMSNGPVGTGYNAIEGGWHA